MLSSKKNVKKKKYILYLSAPVTVSESIRFGRVLSEKKNILIE